MKQQRDGAGELVNDKLRVAWEGLGNTRARRTNTANVGQTCSHTTATCAYLFVQVPFSGKFNPTRTSPVKQRVETTVVTAPVKPQERQITSCLGTTGQHARPSCKHCKACAKHAHAPPPRARTCLHKFHSVGNTNQPVPVPVTQRVQSTT